MNLFAEYEPRPAGTSAEPLPAGMLVRPATGADAVPLAGIAHERHGGDAGKLTEGFAAELSAGGEGGDRLLLVAVVDGAVAGFARVRRFEPAPDAPGNAAPAGWYLAGIVVARAWRRRGIGRELTRRRLAWIAARAPEAWFFANARNRVSIDLHVKLGFREVTRDFWYPGTSFVGGVGILFRAGLGNARPAPCPPAGPAPPTSGP